MMSRALVLNASFEPLGVVSSQRALILVLNSRAEAIEAADLVFRSEREIFEVPSVIRLINYVNVPYATRAALSRRGVFIRDSNTCQYCGASAENIDHVVPRSRGGDHTWENVVASCRRCNSQKDNHLLHETNLRLLRKPKAPKSRAWMIAASGPIPPLWLAYLGVSGSETSKTMTA